MIVDVLVRAGETPRMPQRDYQQCDHAILKRDGFRVLPFRGRVQRWQCVRCGHVMLEGRRQPVDRVAIGRALLEPGATVNQIAQKTGHAAKVVRQVALILADRLPACQCGKPPRHEGRCRLRKCATVVNS